MENRKTIITLRQFCEEREVVVAFSDLEKVENRNIILERIANVQIQYREIECLLLSRKMQLSGKKFEDIREDLQQDIACKILDKKIHYNPKKGCLYTYLLTIVVHQILSDKPKKSVRIEHISEEELQNLPFCEKAIPSIVLEPEYIQSIQNQTCLRRTIIKLWVPWLFQYTFEEDESDLLRQKGVDLLKISGDLQSEIQHNLNKYYVSPEKIGKYLKRKRGAIDQHLKNIRKQLPFLRKGNIGNGNATELE